MDKDKVVTEIVRLVSSLAVGAVVSQVIKSTTPEDIKVVNKIFVSIGGIILSSMISEKASDYTVGVLGGLKLIVEAPKIES
jgi:hypothetical protein